MQYRQLGRSGVRVSVVSLGTGGQWGGRVNRATAGEIVHAALDSGVNYIDTADIYGTWYQGQSVAESFLGEALQGLRDDFVLGSKGYNATGKGQNDWGASRYHLVNAVEASLRRLHTDHLDLYQMHQFDTSTPVDETMRALDDLISAGKVRYIGASNYAAWQICRCNTLAELRGWSRFITTQAHYNLLEREAEQELVPFCREMEVGLLPYFPLANGLLAGRYKPGQAYPADSRAAAFERTRRYLNKYATPEGYAVIEQLTVWAEERGHTLADLAIAWLLTEPSTATVITGCSSAKHMRANALAGDWALTSDDAAQVRAIVEQATDQ